MNACPDWARLLAARDAGGEPAAWRGALEHLDQCPPCRREALSRDPALLFHRLPGAAAGDDEIERMRERVAVLRSAEAVLAPAQGPSSRRRDAMLAASFVLALLGVTAGNRPQGRPPVAIAGDAARAALAHEIARQPVLEQLDRPYDQVVQWSNDDFSMVVLVDERLDV